MKHAYILAAMAIIIFLSGCVSDNVQLGCCIQANATDLSNQGCVLYNTTSFTSTDDYFSSTHGCNLTTLNCNVTIGTADYIIPICSGSELVSCVEPSCTAMVCGDFAFKPQAAPGYNDVSSAQGDVPVNGQSATLQFYKAQCRFLPMDANLKNIMSSSKSQINVFRMGVGGSFDDFDQYRYFFPMSDQYCNINPPQKAEDKRVDRYMNYLSAANGGTAYDGNITTDCLNDTTAPPPFQFSEAQVQKTSTLPSGGTVTYDTKAPDKSEYASTYEYRLDYSAVWKSGYYSYSGTNPLPTDDQVMKQIDDNFYRRALTIAHANDIYATDNNGVSRAEFECDISSNDCFSGSCDTSVYNRGVLQSTDAATGVTTDVVGDCNKVQDDVGLTRVVCGATKSVTINSGNTEPTIAPVDVNMQTALLVDQRGLNEGNSGSGAGENGNPGFNDYQSQNNNLYQSYWGNFSSSEIVDKSFMGVGLSYPYAPWAIDFYLAKKKDCPALYGYIAPGSADENVTVNCSMAFPSDSQPPVIFGVTLPSLPPDLGGAVFFGKTGDTQVNYAGSDILGYAIASPDDIANMYVVKNCGIDLTPIQTTFPIAVDNTPASLSDCLSQCTNICAPAPQGSNIYKSCSTWCSNDTPDPSTQPCEMPPESKDAIMLDVPAPTQWGRLLNAFEPYYEQRMKALIGTGFSDGCGGSLNVLDGAISSMPWVMEYKKGVRTPDFVLGGDSDPVGSGPPDTAFPEQNQYDTEGGHLFLTSLPAQIQRDRNVFDDRMLNFSGTSSCELRRDTYGYWDTDGLNYVDTNDGFVAQYTYNPYYSIAYSTNIYLFKYNATTNKLGKCDIDSDTLLPVIKTLGWCKPCTTSTLAYQNISTTSRVYISNYTVDVGGPTAKDEEGICSVQYDHSQVGWFTTTADNVSCFNPHISDLQDYQGELGIQGSPRTIPDATIIKQKIGNYMKSGVLPVLDLSDISNWIKSNPDCDWDAAHNRCRNNAFNFNWWSTATYGPKGNYLDYDFQNLFGNMGAAVVIVEHVSNLTDLNTGVSYQFPFLGDIMVEPPKIQTIKDRAQIVRDYCHDCLIAFQVDSPDNSTVFGDVVRSAMADPTARADVDMITFDYSVTSHDARTLGNATAVADDIASYGLASLQNTGKPTMVVGLSVSDIDIYWNSNNYKTLFDTIVDGQDTLLKAGIMGIIYSPARDQQIVDSGGRARPILPGSLNGIVSVDPTGAGVKDAKFCALQDAMHRMSTIPPNALITKTESLDSVNCTACTSLDISQGT